MVGLIASAALLLMNGANFGTETMEVVWSIIICVAAFVLLFFVKLHPILVIVLAGIAGFVIYY